MSQINVALTIAGKNIPVLSFATTGGAYGSVGHGEFRTSRTALLAASIDLIALTSAAPAEVEVDLNVQIDTQKSIRIFGGEYVSAEWDYDHDSVQINARDWAGVLVDQKRILPSLAQAVAKTLVPLAPGQTGPSNIQTSNQHISQIIASIAKEFGFTPVLNFQTLNDDTDPFPGTLYGSDNDGVYLTIPQSMWAVLNQFARDTGYEIYTTPTKQLVFGTPGKGITPQVFGFNISQLPPGAVPCRDLKVTHHPRRNSTFRVLVLSYDALRAQTVIGRADNIGINFPDIEPGIWSGNDATIADDLLAESNQKIPVYTFHVDGLTQVQAQNKAQGICADIAKRELIIEATIDGLPSITPTQQINITGQVDNQVSANTFFINSYEHTFHMPEGGGEGGFFTHIKALDIPVQRIGSDTV